jgi:hypothetical protein
LVVRDQLVRDRAVVVEEGMLAAQVADRLGLNAAVGEQRREQQDHDVDGDQPIGEPGRTPHGVDVMDGNHHGLNLPDREP